MADTVRQITADLTPRAQTAMSTGEGENRTVMQIAMHALLGEIAQRRGLLDEAIGHFREAGWFEDTFNYTEPPQWYFPVRHALGAALLAAGRPVEAETVYRWWCGKVLVGAMQHVARRSYVRSSTLPEEKPDYGLRRRFLAHRGVAVGR